MRTRWAWVRGIRERELNVPPDFTRPSPVTAPEPEFRTYDTLGDFFADTERRHVKRAEGPHVPWAPPRPGDLYVEHVRRDSVPERDFSRLGLVVGVGLHEETGAALGPVHVVWSPWARGTDVQPAGR